MKASSTFSPVSALVSRNISSKSDIKGYRESRLEDSDLYIFNYCIYSFHFGESVNYGACVVGENTW